MQLEVNNKTIEYYKFGQGQKTMIIIPGIGVRSTIPMGVFVEKQFSMFKKNFTVYLVERANVLNDTESVDSIALDYLSVFEKLKLKDLYLYGASFGGMLCQSIVKQKPSLVKKIVLASTISGIYDKRENLDNWYKLTKEHKLAELAISMVNSIYSSKVAESIKDETIKNCLTLSEADLKRFATQLKAIAKFDNHSYLKDINCPTLIITAKGDKVFNYHESEYMHEQIKNSELCLYEEDMPHAVYDEASDVPDKIYAFCTK